MKTMQVREFLRGGYRTITEPTLVSSHNRLLFTVLPHGERAWLEQMLRKTGGETTSISEKAVLDDKNV